MNPILRIFILLPFCLILACKTNPIKDPVFVDARNFRIGKLGLKQSDLRMLLVYYNPNGVGLGLEKADLDVYVENKFFGHTNLDTLIPIPAKDTFYIPVKLELDMKNLASNLVSIGLKEEVELKLKGTARLKKAGIGFNFPVNYTGKHRLR